jgi:DNA polymerase III sliding clamp (beta) subunit (PCNA family)
MKLAIMQNILLSALERGGLAAMSEEAQSDSSTLSILIKSVKIKADEKNIIFESGNKLLTTRYVLPITNKEEVVCQEAGEIMVQAKELYSIIKPQKNSKIAISLKLFDKPEIINPLSSEADGAGIKGVKKLGTVKIISQDESEKGIKWTLDCYDSKDMVQPSFALPAKKCFTILTKQIINGFNNISFAVMPKHYQHIFDSICFQFYENKLYMAACDTGRVAVYEIINAKDFCEDVHLLAPANSLNDILKLLEEDSDLSFYHDFTHQKVFVTQLFKNGEEFIAKMNTADSESTKRFPGVQLLLTKKFIPFAKINREKIIAQLYSISVINEDSALFLFKDKELKIQAASDEKHPVSASIGMKEKTDNFNVVWGVKKMLDFLRISKDNEVIFLIKDGVTENSNFIDKSLKLISEQDEKWTYYLMPRDPKKTKYDKDVEE